MSIGQVAERAGVTASRIRFYEDVGVLPPPDRVSGRRRYGEDVLRRLAIVDNAQRAGLTLDEIRALTRPAPAGSAQLRELAARKLPEVDALIERAHAIRRWLELATTCDCETVDVCGLFVEPALAPPPAGGQPGRTKQT